MYVRRTSDPVKRNGLEPPPPPGRPSGDYGTMCRRGKNMTLSRDAVARLAAAGERYRLAFVRVQEILLNLDLGTVPSWVFAIDRHDMKTIKAWNEELYQAELHRRRCQVALHSQMELIALDDPGRHLPASAAESDDMSGLDTADASDLARLDRFISVMHAARAGGALYMNGAFEPVGSVPEPDAKATAAVPPERPS